MTEERPEPETTTEPQPQPTNTVIYKEPGIDYRSYKKMDVTGRYYEALNAIRPLWALLYPIYALADSRDHFVRHGRGEVYEPQWYALLSDIGPMARRALQIADALYGHGSGLDDLVIRIMDVLRPAMRLLEYPGDEIDEDAFDSLYHLYRSVNALFTDLLEAGQQVSAWEREADAQPHVGVEG